MKKFALIVAANVRWSDPYYGLSHLGELEAGKRRVSVQDHGNFALLCKWWPGCGFSPTEMHHKTVTEAKRAGEHWLNNGGE